MYNNFIVKLKTFASIRVTFIHWWLTEIVLNLLGHASLLTFISFICKRYNYLLDIVFLYYGVIHPLWLCLWLKVLLTWTLVYQWNIFWGEIKKNNNKRAKYYRKDSKHYNQSYFKRFNIGVIKRCGWCIRNWLTRLLNALCCIAEDSLINATRLQMQRQRKMWGRLQTGSAFPKAVSAQWEPWEEVSPLSPGLLLVKQANQSQSGVCNPWTWEPWGSKEFGYW